MTSETNDNVGKPLVSKLKFILTPTALSCKKVSVKKYHQQKRLILLIWKK